MRHTNFIKQSSSFQLVNTSNILLNIYRFDLVNGIQILPNPNIEEVSDYFFIKIETPQEDCFMFVIWDNIFEIVRIGDPDVLVIGYNSTENLTIPYQQWDYKGVLVEEGTMQEIGYGFYYIQPINLIKCFFNIENNIISLVTPYKITNIKPTQGGFTSDGLFTDTGFNTFGYLGEKYSYFDLDLGEWVQDESTLAKASDLAKAVTHKYNLSWDDRSSPQWVGNYIKYFRVYDEESGMFRLYAPFATPDNNPNNFDLISEDELGNPYVRGISMLTLIDLETLVEGSSGMLIPFR